MVSTYLERPEHEAHHHGQLINLIYACSFPIPIPESWTDAWGTQQRIGLDSSGYLVG